MLAETGRWGPVRELSADLAQQYHDLLAAHADDPALGACALCQRTRCSEWRHAYEQLVCAGELAP